MEIAYEENSFTRTLKERRNGPNVACLTSCQLASTIPDQMEIRRFSSHVTATMTYMLIGAHLPEAYEKKKKKEKIANRKQMQIYRSPILLLLTYLTNVACG